MVTHGYSGYVAGDVELNPGPVQLDQLKIDTLREILTLVNKSDLRPAHWSTRNFEGA